MVFFHNLLLQDRIRDHHLCYWKENVFITYSATPKCSGLNSSKFITWERGTIPVYITMAAVAVYKIWMVYNLSLTNGTYNVVWILFSLYIVIIWLMDNEMSVSIMLIWILLHVHILLVWFMLGMDKMSVSIMLTWRLLHVHVVWARLLSGMDNETSVSLMPVAYFEML